MQLHAQKRFRAGAVLVRHPPLGTRIRTVPFSTILNIVIMTTVPLLVTFPALLVPCAVIQAHRTRPGWPTSPQRLPVSTPPILSPHSQGHIVQIPTSHSPHLLKQHTPQALISVTVASPCELISFIPKVIFIVLPNNYSTQLIWLIVQIICLL